MPPGVWNLDWLNANAQRNYPLAASANCTDTTNSFVLPQDFLVSLYLPVSTAFNGDSSRFFVQSVGAYANGFSVVIGYQPSAGSPVTVATALINTASHKFGDEYAVGGTGVFLDTFGSLQIGSLVSIGLQPQGSWNFAFESTRLEPDAIRPMIRGVVGLRIRSGGDLSQLLTGIIEIVAGSNMQIDVTIEEGHNPILTFNAIDGAGLSQNCACEENQTLQTITSINSVTPDSSGNIAINGDACIQVSGITNGIQLQDTCSAPCCSCAALQTVTDALEQLGIEERSLQTFADQLQISTSGMELTVLGSALNDQGCITC